MKLKKLLTNSRKCDKIKKHLRLRLLERKSRKNKKVLDKPRKMWYNHKAVTNAAAEMGA